MVCLLHMDMMMSAMGMMNIMIKMGDIKWVCFHSANIGSS